MPKFQKKPVVIEAVQFTGSNHREVLTFVYPDLSEDAIVGAETMRLPVVIETLEGDMTASSGDWVIKGVKGEFYPCKPDIFAATYGPVRDYDKNTIRRFRRPIEDGVQHPNGSQQKYRYGCYFPATDLVVNDMGGRGTGEPDNVEWLDEK